MFLILMVVGLAGLVVMAMPAFGHGHAHGALRFGRGRLHGGGHIGARGSASRTHEVIPADSSTTTLLRFFPSPRTICSLLALYGAFGNALVHGAHLHTPIAACVAVLPALLVERFMVKPVWNLLFRFQGQPSSPLEALLLTEARAVVPFRNGRGVVSAVLDGRMIQLAARLEESQATFAVRVGDRLRIEDVDSRHEKVTVSVIVDS